MFHKYTLSVLLFGAPIFAMGAQLDQGLLCNMSAATFFAPLVQHGLIQPKPYAITDSISYFRPEKRLFSKNSGGLTAFGMRVDGVFGYADGQVMFARGPGTAPPDMYGVIVHEEIANVQAQLNSMGAAKARTRRLDHRSTEITCEGV